MVAMKAAILYQSLTGTTREAGELIAVNLQQEGWGITGVSSVAKPELRSIQDADLIVVGGGPAGTSAAIAAGRLGARVPSYASLHHVVPTRDAERWLDQLLRDKWADLPTAARAASELARLSGDRARDVSERVRGEVLRRLERERADARLVRVVSELVPADELDLRAFLGERLPTGLRLG